MEGIDSYRRWFWSDPERHRLGRLNLINVRHEIVLGAFQTDRASTPTDIARRIGDDYDRKASRARPAVSGRDRNARDTAETPPVRLAHDYQRQLCRASARRSTGSISNGNSTTSSWRRSSERASRTSVSISTRWKKLDATPSEAWIVGDNLEWEVDAASAVGHHSHLAQRAMAVGLPPGSSVRPDRIIRSLPELLQLEM